jgi:hypothetical protein
MISASSQRCGWRRRIGSTVAGAVLAVSACSAPSHDFGEHDHGSNIPVGASIESQPPLPAPWNLLNRNDPSAVAIAAVQAVFGWDPEQGDTGPETAAQRAVPLFTRRGEAEYQPYPVSRPAWQEWMNEQAMITAVTTISTEEHPTDTAVTWHRKTVTTLTIAAPGKVPVTMTVVSLVTEQKRPMWAIASLVHLE